MTSPVLAESTPGEVLLSRVGVILLGGAVLLVWFLGTPDGLLGKADAIGYAVCHRIDLRSFHLGERTLPLCARCSGMYLGILLSITTFSLRKRKFALFPPKHMILLLGLICIGYVIDGANSYLHLLPGELGVYEPSNFLRLTWGVLFGIVMACFIYPAFSQSVWRQPVYQPALRSLSDLFILLIGGMIVVAVVLFENPLFLYPLALLSSATVLIVLTMVYTMVLLMIFKRENRADTLWDVGTVIFAGLTLAVVQVGIFDFIRYSIFGTWGGFNFG